MNTPAPVTSNSTTAPAPHTNWREAFYSALEPVLEAIEALDTREAEAEAQQISHDGRLEPAKCDTMSHLHQTPLLAFTRQNDKRLALKKLIKLLLEQSQIGHCGRFDTSTDLDWPATAPTHVEAARRLKAALADHFAHHILELEQQVSQRLAETAHLSLTDQLAAVAEVTSLRKQILPRGEFESANRGANNEVY